MDFSTFFFLFVLLWHGHWELPLEPISTIGAYCTEYQFDLQVYIVAVCYSSCALHSSVLHKDGNGVANRP